MHGEIQPGNSAFHGPLEQFGHKRWNYTPLGWYIYGLVWYLFTVISVFKILKKYMDTWIIQQMDWIPTLDILVIDISTGLWKNDKIICTYSEDSDQTWHPHRLARVIAVHMKKP